MIWGYLVPIENAITEEWKNSETRGKDKDGSWCCWKTERGTWGPLISGRLEVALTFTRKQQ